MASLEFLTTNNGFLGARTPADAGTDFLGDDPPSCISSFLFLYGRGSDSSSDSGIRSSSTGFLGAKFLRSGGLNGLYIALSPMGRGIFEVVELESASDTHSTSATALSHDQFNNCSRVFALSSHFRDNSTFHLPKKRYIIVVNTCKLFDIFSNEIIS